MRKAIYEVWVWIKLNDGSGFKWQLIHNGNDIVAALEAFKRGQSWKTDYVNLLCKTGS